MHKLIFVFSALLFSSCSLLVHRNAHLSDDDIIINSRLFSPDSTYVIYDYMYDIGAFGYSRGIYSIVAVKDTFGVISKNIIPDYNSFSSITPIKWLDNRSILATVDIENLARENIPFQSSIIKVGDINIRIEQNDPTYGQNAIIEHIAPSPDYKRLLVVYSYKSPAPADISVINFDEKLPILGNVFIENGIETPILYGGWTDNKTIELQINKDADPYGATLNKKKNVIVKKRDVIYNQIYSGIVGGWYNKELYPTDTTFQYELTHFSKKTTVIITEILSWGDSYYTNKSNFFYEYNVNGNVYKSYFRAVQDSIDCKIGDKIEVLYSSRQPLIHKLLKNNFR